MVKCTFKPQHQNVYFPYRSLYITCDINKENLFKITSLTSLWSFLWFSWRLCFIQQWYCLEKLDVNHSQSFEADLIAKYEIYSYIYIYIYMQFYFTGKCKSKAQSEFKIIVLIESVLTLWMTCLGFCFRHYSLNLGFSFMWSVIRLGYRSYQ